MDFDKVEKFVLQRLRNELPESIHYHKVQHTIDVINAAEKFAIAEGLSDRELLLVKTAALFHDTGYIYSPFNNEPIGAEIARKTLGSYGYTPEDVELIASIIMATVWPFNPKTVSEMIICDADLGYLGGERCHEYARLLRTELSEQGKTFSDLEWLDFEIKFLQQHQFFTAAARISCDAAQKRWLEELLEERKMLKK
ncbi:MAG: HD domain-containing protein [Victivallaceae bacterium]